MRSGAEVEGPYPDHCAYPRDGRSRRRVRYFGTEWHEENEASESLNGTNRGIGLQDLHGIGHGALRDQTKVNIRERAGGRKQKPVTLTPGDNQGAVAGDGEPHSPSEAHVEVCEARTKRYGLWLWRLGAEERPSESQGQTAGSYPHESGFSAT